MEPPIFEFAQTPGLNMNCANMMRFHADPIGGTHVQFGARPAPLAGDNIDPMAKKWSKIS